MVEEERWGWGMDGRIANIRASDVFVCGVAEERRGTGTAASGEEWNIGLENAGI